MMVGGRKRIILAVGGRWEGGRGRWKKKRMVESRGKEGVVAERRDPSEKNMEGREDRGRVRVVRWAGMIEGGRE